MDGPDGRNSWAERVARFGVRLRLRRPRSVRPTPAVASPRRRSRMLRHVTVPSPDFRAAIGQFATGVTVVTTLDGGRPVGITVNAFASVSLEPPLVMVALDHRRFIVPAVEASGRYAVNVLAEEEQWLSDCFAGANVTPGRDAFCGAQWRPGRTGLPLIGGAIAALECRVVQRLPMGDHILYIGEVDAATVHEPEAPPLLYHRRRYLRIERASTAIVVGKPESPAN